MKLRIFLIKLINFYQKWISPQKQPSCVFYPTCSSYAKEALNKYDIFKSLKLIIVRITRCHPFQKEHIDLLP